TEKRRLTSRFVLRHEFDFHTTRSIERCADHLKALNFTTRRLFLTYYQITQLRVVDDDTLTFEMVLRAGERFPLSYDEAICGNGTLTDNEDGTTHVRGTIRASRGMRLVIIFCMIWFLAINGTLLPAVGVNAFSVFILATTSLLTIPPVVEVNRQVRVMAVNIYDAVGVLESEGKRKKGKSA
ncbi:MAG: hypothetical protein AAF787_12825, partial [Chloroflexota bacterium]